MTAYPLMLCLGHGSDGAEVIVDIGAGVTTVVVHRGGRIRFTRILPNFGGDDFTSAVAEGLNVSVDEAEHMKRQASGELAAHLSDQAPLSTPSFADRSAGAAPTGGTLTA